MRPSSRTTLIHVVKDVTVHRDTADVFRMLIDPMERARWATTFEEHAKSDAPLTLGQRVDARRRASTSGSRYALTIVELDAPHRVALRVERNGVEVALTRFDVHPNGAGARVVATTEVRLTGLQRLMAPLVSSTLERDLAGELASLKRHAEKG